MLASVFIERAEALYLAFRTSCVGRRYSLRADCAPGAGPPAAISIVFEQYELGSHECDSVYRVVQPLYPLP